MKALHSISLLIALAILPLGCKTPVATPQNPNPTPVIDVARVAHVAGAAAYLGGSLDLIKNPDHRPAFELAVAALRSLESSTNYDAASLAQALAALDIRELKSPEGALYIQAALIVWDEALRYAEPITQKELVRAVLPQIRSGLERALEATKPRP